MKLKKILSALLSAAIFVSVFAVGAVPASAASNYELITVDLESVSKTGQFEALGNNIYATAQGFVRIGSDELKKWRKTGKLKPTKVKTDFKFPDKWTAEGNLDLGNYLTVDSIDSSGTRYAFTLLKYNKKKNQISVVRDYRSGSWKYVNADGYVILDPITDNSTSSITNRVDTPDRKTLRNTFKTAVYENTDNPYIPYNTWVPADGKCLYYTYTISDPQPSQTNPDEKVYTVKVIGVDKKGNEKQIASFYASYFDFRIVGNSGVANSVLYSSQILPSEPSYYLYNDYTQKTVSFAGVKSDYDKNSYNGKEKVSSEFSTITSVDKNNKAIGYYLPFGTLYRDYYGIYKLLDVSGENASVVSGAYKNMEYMYGSNGKIYYVETLSGKQGFINSSGKELATFDMAGSFTGGKYAPVIKNNKAYLIDKNMKRVSEKIDAYYVSNVSYSTGLYMIKTQNKTFLMTYADEDPNPEAPSAVSDSGKAKVSWKKVKNADGYDVYMSASKTGTFSYITTVKGASKTSCTKSGLTKGKTYYFKVRSYKMKDGKKVQSDYSKIISVKAK